MDWSKFWAQGWWQGVGGVVGIIGVLIGVVALYIAIRQNKKKKLGFRTLYSESLLNIDKQLKNDLKITYKGYEVEQIHVLKIEVINHGDVPIKKDDFEGPVEIMLESCNNIFDVEISDSFPLNLKVPFKNIDNRILIEPFLINPKDRFSLQITFDGQSRNFSLDGRIEGVSLIDYIPSNDNIIVGPITTTVVVSFIGNRIKDYLDDYFRIRPGK